jgi:YggT family protein
MVIFAEIIYRLAQLLILVVLIDIILSYFVPPWNRVREILEKIVEPLLRPIRKVIKPVGGLDFSPIVLRSLYRSFRIAGCFGPDEQVKRGGSAPPRKTNRIAADGRLRIRLNSSGERKG